MEGVLKKQNSAHLVGGIMNLRNLVAQLTLHYLKCTFVQIYNFPLND